MLKFLTPTKLLRTKENTGKKGSPSNNSSTSTRSTSPPLAPRRWGSVLSTFWHRGSDKEALSSNNNDADSCSLSHNSLSDEEILSPHSLKRAHSSKEEKNDSEEHFKISNSFAKKLKSQESIYDDQIIDVVGLNDSYYTLNPIQPSSVNVIETPLFKIVSFPPQPPPSSSSSINTDNNICLIEIISKRHRHLETIEKRIRRREIELIKYNEHINSLKRSAPELWSNRANS